MNIRAKFLCKELGKEDQWSTEEKKNHYHQVEIIPGMQHKKSMNKNHVNWSKDKNHMIILIKAKKAFDKI